MNSQTSRKVIVASAMAAVVGIGVVTFALRSHHPVAPAQTPHPPAPVAQIPADAPAAVAQIPDALAAIAQNPDAPAPVAQDDSVSIKTADTATRFAIEGKPAPR
ncbi:MAG: hypothetical protein JWO04_4875 [Gammaproteobacteria bacterium]|nr:hypothetical protein [Gammaproteobacteria bacterium]